MTSAPEFTNRAFVLSVPRDAAANPDAPVGVKVGEEPGGINAPGGGGGGGGGGQGLARVPCLCAHTVLVFPYTLAASSSLAWPLVP